MHKYAHILKYMYTQKHKHIHKNTNTHKNIHTHEILSASESGVYVPVNAKPYKMKEIQRTITGLLCLCVIRPFPWRMGHTERID